MNKVFEEYKGKRALVTGGAGCIGRNLTLALLAADVERVYVLDDLSAAETWNIPKDPRVTFIHGSILDDEILKHAFTAKPDYVFHLAAHFANQNSVDHPETDLAVNGTGIIKVLSYSNLTKVKRFVYASSGCSVYGSEAPLPLREDFTSLHLDTPYQITKLLGELYCNFFHTQYGLPIVNCRFFNVFGPGEIPGNYRNVIPNFTYRALKGLPLTITGTGEETRDFTFVEDIVDGVMRCGVIPEAIGDAFNLASETETQIIDLAKMINEMTGNKAGIKYIPQRDWDKITKRRASIEKAGRVLGYKPKTDVPTGLPRVLAWFEENRENIEKTARF